MFANPGDILCARIDVKAHLLSGFHGVLKVCCFGEEVLKLLCLSSVVFNQG